MKTTLLFLIVAASLQIHAQDEFNRLKIPPGKIKPKEAAVPKEVLPQTDLPPAVVEKPDPLKVAEAELLKEPTRYQKDSETPSPTYQRDQYLGGVKTKSKVTSVRYRDAAAIDGDKIKVILNGKVVEPEVTMDGQYNGIKLNLTEGVNQIDFEALNEGFASPNTAEFQVYDDKGVVIKSSQWNVGTGYKATVLVLKE